MASDPNRRRGLRANVHRFRDTVAVSVGTGETTYLSPAQARQLARALYVAARDVEHVEFIESKVVTKTIDIN